MSAVQLLCADGAPHFDAAAVRNVSGMFVMLRVGERYVALRAPLATGVWRTDAAAAAADDSHAFVDASVHRRPLAPDDGALRRTTPAALLVAPEVGAHYADERVWSLGATVLLVPRRYRLATRHELDGSDDHRAVLAVDELYALHAPPPRRRRLFSDDGGDDAESSGGWIERLADDF